MAAFDHGIKIIARTTGRELARLAGITCDHWQPAESTVQATVEKLADRVFLARQGQERFVVYFEFYTSWDAAAPWDLLAKSALLSQRERLATCVVAVVLRPQGFRSGKEFRLSARGQPTQALWYEEVCLWTMEPQAWWEKVPGLMALYPLCRHQRPPQEAITHAAGVIEKRVKAEGDKADLLTILGFFSELAYAALDPLTLIGRAKMQASKMYQQILNEGKQAGLLEGALTARRNDILKLLRLRLETTVPKKVAAAVNAVTDPEELDRLFEVAVSCADLGEFRAALGT